MRVIILAALLALPLSTATAAEWCGFVDKTNAQVQCGYSSLDECKQALPDKQNGYCMPDPGFARLGAAKMKVASRTGD